MIKNKVIVWGQLLKVSVLKPAFVTVSDQHHGQKQQQTNSPIRICVDTAPSELMSYMEDKENSQHPVSLCPTRCEGSNITPSLWIVKIEHMIPKKLKELNLKENDQYFSKKTNFLFFFNLTFSHSFTEGHIYNFEQYFCDACDLSIFKFIRF